jgi:16S rRNA (uracil1498-N3)-methyltransferase
VRPRFHVPDLDPAAARVPLPADEAEHVVRVLRLGAGAAGDVFDGRGGLWRAEIVQADKRGVSVRPCERVIPAAETRVPATLVMSVLKGDKMDEVVRDAVMLGVTAIQPVVSERTEMGSAALTRSRRVERWQRVAVSSVKQCGRAVVPVVREPLAFGRYLAVPPHGVRLMFVEPSATVGKVVPVREVPVPMAADLIVGPEGGWTPEEVKAAAAAGARLVSLGARTLRADAVPLVALTALLTVWSEL